MLYIFKFCSKQVIGQFQLRIYESAWGSSVNCFICKIIQARSIKYLSSMYLHRAFLCHHADLFCHGQLNSYLTVIVILLYSLLPSSCSQLRDATNCSECCLIIGPVCRLKLDEYPYCIDVNLDLRSLSLITVVINYWKRRRLIEE